MLRNFTLEYWTDEGWYIGKLIEVPGVYSEGRTLEELERNIQDVYAVMMKEGDLQPAGKAHKKEIDVLVCN